MADLKKRRVQRWRLAAILVAALISQGVNPAQALQYKMFGNADAVESTKPNVSNGFIKGTVDFFITEKIGERTDVLTEITVHPHKTGLAGIDLERLQVGYLFHDGFRLWMGRFHNLLGYWNLAYHHGLIFQTSVDRPEFLKWEHDGGLLPTHMNGLWAEGRWPMGPVKLNYGVMLGNGLRIVAGGPQPNNVGDDSDDKMASFNLTARPRRLPFSGLGVSSIRSRIIEWKTATTVATDTRQTVLGAHFFHTQAPWEFIAELYQVGDKGIGVSESTGSHVSSAYFIQVGYGFREKIIPYYRLERVNANDASSYIQALGRNAVTQNFVTGVLPTSAQDHTRHVLGVRYNLDVRSALKAEFRYLDVPGGATADDQVYKEMAFQWAFSF